MVYDYCIEKCKEMPFFAIQIIYVNLWYQRILEKKYDTSEEVKNCSVVWTWWECCLDIYNKDICAISNE